MPRHSLRNSYESSHRNRGENVRQMIRNKLGAATYDEDDDQAYAYGSSQNRFGDDEDRFLTGDDERDDAPEHYFASDESESRFDNGGEGAEPRTTRDLLDRDGDRGYGQGLQKHRSDWQRPMSGSTDSFWTPSSDDDNEAQLRRPPDEDEQERTSRGHPRSNRSLRSR